MGYHSEILLADFDSSSIMEMFDYEVPCFIFSSDFDWDLE